MRDACFSVFLIIRCAFLVKSIFTKICVRKMLQDRVTDDRLARDYKAMKIWSLNSN